MFPSHSLRWRLGAGGDFATHAQELSGAGTTVCPPPMGLLLDQFCGVGDIDTVPLVYKPLEIPLS